MVHPQELRIGNKVWWRKEEEIHYTINMMDFHSLDVFSKIEPIEITPDILVKCGCEYIGKTEDVYKLPLTEYTHLVIGKMKKEIVFTMWELHFFNNQGDPAFPYTLDDQLYLHQLQNLYFSLTGKELQIEL